MTQSENEADFPKPLVWTLSLLTAAILFKLFNQLVADYDLWWHIVIGKNILLNGALQRTDIYSFTAAGHPYINHEWASELIMAGAYRLSDPGGLILWRWGMVILIVLLALNLVKRTSRHPLSRIAVMLSFGVVLAPGISFRVQLFSYLFLLVLLNLLYSKQNQGDLPSICGISALFALWANFHGAFVLGLFIWFIYVLARVNVKADRNCFRKLLLYVVLPSAATLLNPYGPGLWKFIWHELTNPISARYITEWQRFAFAPRELPFLGVMLITWGAFFLSGRKKEIPETLVLILAGLMGMMAVRNTPLFVILALPAMARHIDGACLRLMKKAGSGQSVSRTPVVVTSVVFAGLSVFFLIMGMPPRWEIRVDNDPVPVRTVAFMKDNGFKGNLWVPLHFGGYALFHLYPDIRVSMDGRWTMVYPRDIMQDNMDFSYHGTGGKWKEILKRHGADFAMVEPGNPAAQEMGADMEWAWAFAEPACGLLVNTAYFGPIRPSFNIPEQKPTWP